MTRVWFITGASSGFGLGVAEIALRNGEIVVATCRNPANAKALQALQSTYPQPKLLIVPLDVTDPTSVKAAFKTAVDKYGRVDVVLNNAGYALVSEVEYAKEAEKETEEKVRKNFETNYWGAVTVSKEAIRVFREVNLERKKEGVADIESRMIVVSSAAVWMSIPGIAYYTSNKAALEGLIETLAGEVNPEWNIKITIVQPGEFKTNAGTSSIDITAPPAAYQDPKLVSYAIRQHYSGTSFESKGDPNKAAEAIVKLSKLESPPVRLPLGKDAVGAAKARLQKNLDEIAKFEYFSDDLVFSS